MEKLSSEPSNLKKPRFWNMGCNLSLEIIMRIAFLNEKPSGTSKP
jgi:hypothetical protein